MGFSYQTIYNSDKVVNQLSFQPIKPGDFVNYCEYQRSRYGLPEIQYGFVLYTEYAETYREHPASGSQRVYVCPMPHPIYNMQCKNFHNWIELYIKFAESGFKFANAKEDCMYAENGIRILKTEPDTFGSKRFVTDVPDVDANEIPFGRQNEIELVYPCQVAQYNLIPVLKQYCTEEIIDKLNTLNII